MSCISYVFRMELPCFKCDTFEMWKCSFTKSCGILMNLVVSATGLGPYSHLCVRKFLAYLRQLGILVSLRTQGIVRTLILVFLPLAYAKTVFSTFCVGKMVFWGLAYVGRKRTLCEIRQREVRQSKMIGNMLVGETEVSWAGFCLKWHKFGMIKNINICLLSFNSPILRVSK